MSTSGSIADVRVTLPEHWWPISLADEHVMRAGVRDLVQHEFDGVADNPLVQSDLRRALLEQAEAGRSVGARLLALCRQWHNGTPIPASLVLTWIDLPAGRGSSPGEQLLELQGRLHPDPDAPMPAGQTLDLAALPPGTVLRHVRLDETPIPPSDGREQRIPALVADYWLERPDQAGLIQLAFSSPIVPIRDAWLELWDAIVGTLRWVPEPTGA
ncbi:MAG TPA: hypothetical protein VM347_34565 [Nonomuraea sp.]|nr:hypothetical protein [Nonomuraea sp.]